MCLILKCLKSDILNDGTKSRAVLFATAKAVAVQEVDSDIKRPTRRGFFRQASEFLSNLPQQHLFRITYDSVQRC